MFDIETALFAAKVLGGGLAYLTTGYVWALVTDAIYFDDTPTEELPLWKTVLRAVHFPSTYFDALVETPGDAWEKREKRYSDKRSFFTLARASNEHNSLENPEKGAVEYRTVNMFFWPLKIFPFSGGTLVLAIAGLTKAATAIGRGINGVGARLLPSARESARSELAAATGELEKKHDMLARRKETVKSQKARLDDALARAETLLKETDSAAVKERLRALTEQFAGGIRAREQFLKEAKGALALIEGEQKKLAGFQEVLTLYRASECAGFAMETARRSLLAEVQSALVACRNASRAASAIERQHMLAMDAPVAALALQMEEEDGRDRLLAAAAES